MRPRALNAAVPGAPRAAISDQPSPSGLEARAGCRDCPDRRPAEALGVWGVLRAAIPGSAAGRGAGGLGRVACCDSRIGGRPRRWGLGRGGCRGFLDRRSVEALGFWGVLGVVIARIGGRLGRWGLGRVACRDCPDRRSAEALGFGACCVLRLPDRRPAEALGAWAWWMSRLPGSAIGRGVGILGCVGCRDCPGRRPGEAQGLGCGACGLAASVGRRALGVVRVLVAGGRVAVWDFGVTVGGADRTVVGV